MSFKLPDLIIESILRDGFENARRDPSVIDDVFCDLTRAYASKKYGNREIEKIKRIIEEDEVSIIHAFNPTQIEVPAISIQLADDKESTERAAMGNLRGMTMGKLKDQEKEDLIKVQDFTPTGFNPATSMISVDDSINLSAVYANLIFLDAAGIEWSITGGIDNTPGRKGFFIDTENQAVLGSVPNISGDCLIKSFLNYSLFQKRGNIEQTQIILGIHTKEPLLTKYLYILVKYFMLSRRDDLIQRGFALNTYAGSDFMRDTNYGADLIFTRFFNIIGTVEHEWRSDKVQLIDSIEVTLVVPKDRAGNKELKLEDMTIKVKE